MIEHLENTFARKKLKKWYNWLIVLLLIREQCVYSPTSATVHVIKRRSASQEPCFLVHYLRSGFAL